MKRLTPSLKAAMQALIFALMIGCLTGCETIMSIPFVFVNSDTPLDPTPTPKPHR